LLTIAIQAFSGVEMKFINIIADLVLLQHIRYLQFLPSQLFNYLSAVFVDCISIAGIPTIVFKFVWIAQLFQELHIILRNVIEI